MDLFWTQKLFRIVQLTRIHHPYVCRMSTTPSAWSFPPPDTLSGNHPELAVHPRMNFRSEQRASYYVRASIAFHLSCNAIDCYAWFIFIVSPPSFIVWLSRRPLPMPMWSTTSSTTVRPLPSSFQASRATSPLPHIAYLPIFIYCTRHMLLRYFPIQMHSLSLSPLAILSVSYAAWYI